ncbi:hypothetical protein LENED_006254 [Lentinula edodes]|uniref:Uncharacterized protein n=1 Tax=Lentinula edodes TaxID=5353 RepID=A0A1Q3EBI8_LENED|nr:hypothetical protein LENED_006254 [Lentinula edodes]
MTISDPYCVFNEVQCAARYLLQVLPEFPSNFKLETGLIIDYIPVASPKKFWMWKVNKMYLLQRRFS